MLRLLASLLTAVVALTALGCLSSSGPIYSESATAISPDTAMSEPAFIGEELVSLEPDLRLAQAGQKPADGQPSTPDVPPSPVVPQPDSSAPVQQPSVAGPLLIYSANLQLAVFEAAKSIDLVQQMAADSNGYLVKRSDRSIVIRVPAKHFRATMDKITKLGDVLTRDENVRDVTEEFYDLKVRIKNARAMRDRLEVLLKQAKDVKEALMVEKELARVTSEIEQMEGKLKLMNELITFSTITVDFRPQPVDQVNSRVRLPFGWMDTLGLTNLLNLD